MGSLVPINDDGYNLTPRRAAQAVRIQGQADIAVFRHGLQAAMQAEFDRQDGQAVADAIRASLDEELDLLEWGAHRSGQSAAKTELVARKVEMLSSINNRRLTRHFGR